MGPDFQLDEEITSFKVHVGNQIGFRLQQFVHIFSEAIKQKYPNA